MDDVIRKIKSRIDIVNLISEYVPLTKGGKNYKGLCPFHDERTPSFMVSPELQIFKCFGCGKGGDAIAFIQEIEGIPFRDALELLARRVGVPLKKGNFKRSPEEIKKKKILEINQLAAEYFQYILKNHRFGKKAISYLKSRGIKNSTMDVYKIGYAPNSWDSLINFLLKRKYDISLIASSGLAVPKERNRGFYDRFRGRVIIPLRNERGEIVGFSGRSLDKAEPKYLNGPETLVFKKARFLYNLDLARGEIKRKKEAVLVEGYFDAITPYQAGFKNVVASLGTSLTAGQLSLIKRFSNTLTIFYDTDSAGVEATKRALNLALDVGVDVKVGVLPDYLKDPDEAVREDKRIFEKALKSAVSIYDFYFNYVKRKYDLRKPLEKKKAADFLLPIIAGISHTIQKAHYIKKIANMLDVSDETIAESIEKLRFKSASGRKNAFEARAASPKLSPQEYILALILKSPKSLAQKTLYKLSSEDFEGSPVKPIFVKLKDYLLNKERFSLKNFCLKLARDENKLVEKLHLMELPIAKYIEDDEGALDSEIKKMFDIINKETLRRKLREVSRKIKEAEEVGDKGEVKKLQKEFLSLSGKQK